MKYSRVFAKIMGYFSMFGFFCLIGWCVYGILLLVAPKNTLQYEEFLLMNIVISTFGTLLVFLANELRWVFSKNRHKNVVCEDLSLKYYTYNGKIITISICEALDCKSYRIYINYEYRWTTYAKSIESALHEAIQRLNAESEVFNESN